MASFFFVWINIAAFSHVAMASRHTSLGLFRRSTLRRFSGLEPASRSSYRRMYAPSCILTMRLIHTALSSTVQSGMRTTFVGGVPNP